MVRMILSSWIFFVFINIAACFEKEMTVSVQAGQENCFYQNAKVGEMIDIEYQVIDGGHGDLHITFHMVEPGTGRIIFSDYKKSDNIHRYQANLEGDYRFCFDNKFSSFNQKIVFFELIIENEDEPQNDWKHDILEGLSPEEFYDMKVQDIQESINKIRTSVTRSRQLQDVLRSHEARDRNIAEENYFKVNAWSFFQIILMLCVGGVQVIMVRSLFDTKSKVHKIWSKFS